MPRGKKVDNNHAEIRDGLRQLGFKVMDVSALGKIPDLLIVDPVSGRLAFLAEVKDNPERFTKSEVEFYLFFVDPAIRVFVSLDQAVEILQELRTNAN